MNTPLELKPGRFAASNRQRRVQTLAVLFAVLAVIAAVMFPLFAGVDWSKAWSRLLSGSLPVLELGAAALLGAGHYWYTKRGEKLERLFLDERGMRYQSPLPDWMAGLQPSWFHRWEEIRSARVVIPRLALHHNTVALMLNAGGAQRRLTGMWVPAAGAEEEPARGTPLFSSHAAIFGRIAEDVERSALVQYMRRMGVKVEMREGPRSGFALERNRATRVALALIFVLIGYAIVDFLVNSETYAVKPPAVLYVLAGVMVLLASGLVLALNRVPQAESWGVSVVLGAAFAAALYPGLLRVNQLTDGEGLKPRQYRLEDYVLLKPVDPKLPDLTFIDFHEYWQQFPRGSQHEFLMRRGALGFHQVDMGPVHERMREFYRR